ncbi:hypothetical protein LUX33_16470 [Actinomadura madurae]|uniref:beta-ketoacyl synthase N-terminal-like domain-containing protein n=1 Tax=Actinomadura madurae TaxID=1993 RepID=UPI0020D21DF5|nr:beta-ketoacyl synthase N-terminal-like domain-containing protein [Actinomadura madurae]MCP9949836.1 hypothetical protein [Actinomadura madurae]
MREPIAIIGIACLYPEARGAGDFWRRLCEDPAGPPSTASLDDVDVDVARFGIPPVQRTSMTRMQVLMLEAARQCLTDAGYTGRPLGTDRTDVIAGTCLGLDRQYANALRIEAARYARDLEREVPALFGGHARPAAARAARELRARVTERLGASPHDRVGEMASTIPARIAGAFRLRGRTLAVESADATSFAALAHAVNGLRGDLCDAVLVLTGQRRESPSRRRAARRQGAARHARRGGRGAAPQAAVLGRPRWGPDLRLDPRMRDGARRPARGAALFGVRRAPVPRRPRLP